jgi:hypothetical protein
MKYLILIFATLTLNANESLEWIDNKISQISKQRDGVKKNHIIALTNPFVLKPIIVQTVEQNSSKKEVIKEEVKVEERIEQEKAPLELSAIVNNYVKINSRWYNIGDDIEGYIIKKTFSNYILLQQDKELIKLYVNKNNSKIKINRH